MYQLTGPTVVQISDDLQKLQDILSGIPEVSLLHIMRKNIHIELLSAS